jgi:hypothetical protein
MNTYLALDLGLRTPTSKKILYVAAVTLGVVIGALAVILPLRAHADGPVLSAVALTPNGATLVKGDVVTVYFQESNISDTLAPNGPCTVNGVDVSSSFADLTGGSYHVLYTIATGDANRAAGTIPINCSLIDTTSATPVVVTAFTDNNTTAIDLGGSDNGGGGGGTVDIGALSTAIHAAQTAHDSAEEGSEPGRYAPGSKATLQLAIDNATNVLNNHSATQANIDAALTTLNAAKAAFDATKIPADNGGGGNNGGNGGNGGNNGGNGTSTPTTTPTVTVVAAQPDSGMLSVGNGLTVFIRANRADLTVGSCTINHVDVASSFTNLTDNLYRLIYYVGANDMNQPAGGIPVNCTLTTGDSTANVLVRAFTDGNSTGIHATSSTTTNPGGNNGSNTGGGLTGTVSDAVLSVTSITPVNTVAAADGTFDHGWKWIFNITAPSNETRLSMKFGDWLNTSSGTIPTAGNMRISSSQASSADPVMITSSGAYSTALTLTADRDSTAAGRQVQVTVEVNIPSGTANGSYSTTYGVQSMQP